MNLRQKSEQLIALMERSVEEKLLNDFIIFMITCPNGLGLTEVEIVLRMLPCSLDPDVKQQKIQLYLDIFAWLYR